MGKSDQLAYERLPPQEALVWRYISLAKLLAVFRTRALFLTRADLLDDPFEGAFSEGSLRDFAREWGSDVPETQVILGRWLPCVSYVSCWHLSEIESAALWKVYAGSDSGLALRTTIGKLQATFPEKNEATEDHLICQAIRRVQYIDYRTEHPYLNDLMGPLCYKRQAFAFEQEVRVIRQEIPSGPSNERPAGRAIKLGGPPERKGIEASADLKSLIEAVYVAPSSPHWLLETVRETMRRFDLDEIPCRQSSLDELPEFGRFST